MRSTRLLARLAGVLAGAAALVWVGASASAGAFTPCEAPFVFSNEAANIVPIEFLATASDAYTSSADRERLEKLQHTAQHLAWLTQLDSYQQPSYGSLGAVAHLFLDRVCQPDEILEGIIAGRGMGQASPGQVLVVLQGHIFIEGEQILVQSRLRGFRLRDVHYSTLFRLSDHPDYMQPEMISAALGNRALQGRLPALDVTFAPRVVTESELAEVDERFGQASRLHRDPSDNSPSEPLRFEPTRPQAFSVDELLDGGRWLKITEFFESRTGYIRTDPKASDFLHARLPELDLLNGILGYLRLVQEQREGHNYPPPPRYAAHQARTSLDHFLERPQTAAEPDTRALARALLGAIALHEQDGARFDGPRTAASWQAARTEFRETVRLVPYNSTYRNLLGIADAWLCCAGSSPFGEFGDPAVDFTDSLSLDPQNLESLRNLNVFLAALGEIVTRGVHPAGVDTSRLPERREVLEHALAGMKN
jgi:hypothetical protein